MSDWDDDPEEFNREDLPPMDTPEGRQEWIDILLLQDDPEDWAQAQVVQEGKDMVARFRWADGREEVYDLQIRKSMEVVKRAPPGEQN